MREDRTGPGVPLSMNAAEFRKVGRRLVDRIARHLEEVPRGPVTPGGSPQEVREALGATRDLPADGMAVAELVEETVELLLENSLFNGHPRFFGYITSSPAPVGALADLLASAVNPNVGGWTLAPMATEMEAQTIRWLAQLIGFPEDCGGILVSGGNVANYVGFLAARAEAGESWRIRERGLAGHGAESLRVYCSPETHTWIEKAADLFGIGTDSVRLIETDRSLRMAPRALAHAVAEDRGAGLRPFLVVGTAGSTSTGVVDPLEEMADFCRDDGLWLHVDAAYGGFAAKVPGTPPDLRALSRADSVAVDPHKWLYFPLEAGCALVRRPETMREAFSYHPPYYHFGVEATNYVDFGPQNSRGFRALKVWMGLRQVGQAGCLRMIGDDIDLARHLHSLVEETPDLEAMAQGLSISVFRYVPAELEDRAGNPEVREYLNDLNQEIQDRMERGGEAFLSNAVVRGVYGLRACIVNFNTTVADVEALPEIVLRIGGEIHRERTGEPSGAISLHSAG